MKAKRFEIIITTLFEDAYEEGEVVVEVLRVMRGLRMKGGIRVYARPEGSPPLRTLRPDEDDAVLLIRK